MLDSSIPDKGLHQSAPADESSTATHRAHCHIFMATELLHNHAPCLPDLEIRRRARCARGPLVERHVRLARSVERGSNLCYPADKSMTAHRHKPSRCAAGRPSPSRKSCPLARGCPGRSASRRSAPSLPAPDTRPSPPAPRHQRQSTDVRTVRRRRQIPRRPHPVRG